MNITYKLNGLDVTLDEIKQVIINDYLNTELTKGQLSVKYSVGRNKVTEMLRGLVKPRKCKKCGEDDQTKFYGNDKTCCNACQKEKHNKRYASLTPEEKKNKIDKQQIWVKNNMITTRVLAASSRARYRGLPFNLTNEYIFDLYHKQNGRCLYSDIPINVELFDDQTEADSFSIDRINPSLGYVQGNIALTSIDVNTMKSSLSLERLYILAEKIYKNKFLRNLVLEVKVEKKPDDDWEF